MSDENDAPWEAYQDTNTAVADETDGPWTGFKSSEPESDAPWLEFQSSQPEPQVQQVNSLAPQMDMSLMAGASPSTTVEFGTPGDAPLYHPPMEAQPDYLDPEKVAAQEQALSRGLLTRAGVGPENMPTGQELITATGAHPSIAYPLSAVSKTVTGVVDWMTSPVGFPQLVAASIPGVNLVMGAKFAKDMIEGGYVSAKDVGVGLAEGNWQKVAEGVSNYAANVLGVKAVVGHGIKNAKTDTGKFSEFLQGPGPEFNVERTAAIGGQPVRLTEPTERSGIPDTVQSPEPSPAASSELRQTSTAPAEAPAGAGSSSAVPKAQQKFAPEEVSKAISDMESESTRTEDAYKVGNSVSSIEDLNKLLAGKVKFKGSMAHVAGQFFREAIERATKSGSVDPEIKRMIPMPEYEAPLDYRKNPEVAKWLLDNNDRLRMNEDAIGKIRTFVESTPQPDWRVSVQSPQGEMPGNVQIIDPRGKENSQSPTVESLRKAGHDVPDFSQLPQDRYTYEEAVKLLKEKPPTPAAETPATTKPTAAGEQVRGELSKMFQKMADEDRGKQMLEQLSEEGKTPKNVVDEFWNQTYPNLPTEIQNRFHQLLTKETGFKPGDVIAKGPNGERITASSWNDVYSSKEAPQKIQHLEGTERGLVAMMETANRNRDVLSGKNVLQLASDWTSATEETPTTETPQQPKTSSSSLAAVESEKATQAWGKHSIEVVDPLKAEVRALEKASTEMRIDAKRTLPETKSRERITKKAFLEKYRVATMDEANALFKKKNAEWQTKIDELKSATDKLADLNRLKDQAAKNWSSAVTREKASKLPPTAQMGSMAPPKFPNRKMSPLDKVTSSHSAKLQKSMDEARRAQKEIKREVPSERRQGAISIYREAGGDMALLKEWETNAKQKWMRDAARDAQTVTPKELAIEAKAKAAYEVMEKRGNTNDVLKSHRENYVTHIWDVKKPGSGWGGGMLQQRFKFSKARTFNTFFEGDQAGFKPKTLAIGKLLPAYLHEMNKVIADRQFVSEMMKEKASDGEPLGVQRGNVQVVDNPEGKAVLVQPRSPREADTGDYKTMENQPALHDWIWQSKDTDGNPIFVKADIALHPEAYRRINAMLGQSALRTWYREPVGGTAQIPRAIARGLDTAQAAMKREMFGLLAPFHQVQEGTHAVGHLVNPFFGIEKIDFRKPGQMDAAKHGLMLLPDRASSRSYLEGVGTKSSLLSQGIRKGGKVGEAVSDVIDGYQDYLFHQYIPGLKYKTYEAMLGRNTKLYAKELASGDMTPADVKITSAEQANAAYGHLNYALLDRNPTIQHIIQIGALAPDFLEARARFAGQAIKGLSSKVGHEQLKAIAIIAAAQAGTAFALSSLLGVPYDPKHPFEVIYKGRRYAMRSVPEDIFTAFKDTRQFLYSRVNPLTVKGGIQLATGLNYRGEKTTPLETITELLAGYIPITARSLPGIRSLTETGRNSPITPLQQLSGSLGLRVSRYSPVSETYKLAGDWMDKQKMPKDRGSYPISKYQSLRYALEDGDLDRAKAAYAELKKTMTPGKISSGFRESVNHPFTGSKANDAKFAATLKGYDKEMFLQALRTRRNILNLYGRATQ